MEHTSKPVVVHCDGSASSLEAALWAIDEALTRRTWLRLVAVLEPSVARVEGRLDATRRMLRSASAFVRAGSERVLVKAEVLIDDPASALVAESRDAALMCLGLPRDGCEGGLARWVAQRSTAPVALVGRRHAYPHPSGDRWVVAVIRDEASAESLWRTAADEARMRGAALMVLSPPGGLSERRVAELHRGCGDLEIWLMPEVTDVASLLRQAPDLEHTVVVSGDDAALIDVVVGPSDVSGWPLTGNSVVVLPQAGSRQISEDAVVKAGPAPCENISRRSHLVLTGSRHRIGSR